MKYLFVYAIFVMTVVTVGAHLRGTHMMLPQPLVPVGSPLNDPTWTGLGTFNGGWNNAFMPERGWNNFRQWPQQPWTSPNAWNNDITGQPWTSPNVWNNDITATGNQRNNFNNNALPRTDPWEQYKRFNSGVRHLIDDTRPTNGVLTNTIATQNQIPLDPVSNNYPWNSFATQNNFNTNIPAVSNGFNQGFVSPQLQQNVNNQFQNQAFQRFPNRLPATNGVFV